MGEEARAAGCWPYIRYSPQSRRERGAASRIYLAMDCKPLSPPCASGSGIEIHMSFFRFSLSFALPTHMILHMIFLCNCILCISDLIWSIYIYIYIYIHIYIYVYTYIYIYTHIYIYIHTYIYIWASDCKRGCMTCTAKQTVIV